MSTLTDSDTARRELTLERTVRAPRDLVFAAYTSAEHITKWWGPDGFTTVVETMDVRPGGEWRFLMIGPDGTEYTNLVVYRRVEPPELLAFRHSDGDGANGFDVTITFTEAPGGTHVRQVSRFDSVEARQAVEEFGAVELGQQTMRKLSEYVEDELSAAFRLERVVAAPRALVFRAWTEPEHLARWWGPAAMAIAVRSFDLRPGGLFVYSMTAPDGSESFGRWLFEEITPPERIVWRNAFADAHGNAIPAPFDPAFPVEILCTVSFSEDGAGTRLNLFGRPAGRSDTEREAYRALHDSMRQGFGATFDQLDAYLARLR